VLNSEDNPQANPDGTINVRAGNRIPGIPRNLFEVGADYDVTTAWTVGFSAIVASGKYMVGDESNLNDTTGSYGVLNAHTSYQIAKNIQVFAQLENVLNARTTRHSARFRLSTAIRR
jgi:iron complex outermembrane recepter protein